MKPSEVHPSTAFEINLAYENGDTTRALLIHELYSLYYTPAQPQPLATPESIEIQELIHSIATHPSTPSMRARTIRNPEASAQAVNAVMAMIEEDNPEHLFLYSINPQTLTEFAQAFRYDQDIWESMLSSLGLADLPNKTDPKTTDRIMRNLRNNPHLLDLIEALTTMRPIAQTINGEPGTDPSISNDLLTLAPVELISLATDPNGFARRYANHELQTTPTHTQRHHGGVIIITDESTSMAGKRGHTAKALTLLLADAAIRRGERAIVVRFAGTQTTVMHLNDLEQRAIYINQQYAGTSDNTEAFDIAASIARQQDHVVAILDEEPNYKTTPAWDAMRPHIPTTAITLGTTPNPALNDLADTVHNYNNWR